MYMFYILGSACSILDYHLFIRLVQYIRLSLVLLERIYFGILLRGV